MAGLLAANMLRRHEVKVLEKAQSLPDNHTAVLRFKTTAVSDATGIPFTKETVHKGLLKNDEVVNTATLQDSNRYSLMVTGGNLFNRSIMNLESGERWCAPKDFVQQMARKVDIMFNVNCGFGSHTNPDFIMPDQPVISTVPMPFMMDMMGWRNLPEFKYLPVWTIKTTVLGPTIKVCQTIYNINRLSWYRATLHGQELTLEFMDEPAESMVQEVIVEAMRAFGFGIDFVRDLSGEIKGYSHEYGFSTGAPTLNKIAIGKIQPIDETVRKRFLLWLTEKHNIYSLGRFATWRNILLDDIVKDVKQIESMIERQHTYEGHIN